MTTSPTEAIDDVALDVRPLAGHIGAEILGVDLTAPLEAQTVAAIRSTLLRWKVIFFRDQHLDQAQHLAFVKLFGEPTPAHPTLPAMFPEFPEILLLDNLQFASKETSSGKAPAASVESRWHTDVTFSARPPMASVLRGVILPEYGGDTQWTNLVVAYQRLSAPIRQMIDSLHAVHVNAIPSTRPGAKSQLSNQFSSRLISSVHPMVRVHPETGERALFVNPLFTTEVLELSGQEGRHLLAMLYEHMTNPEFTVRFRWYPGSMAFWDNRATAHLVPTDVPAGVQRSMQRITLAGDLPIGPDGSTSYSLVGDD